MRTYLMARSKKLKQAPRELQYIAKISCSITFSLKFWVNIFRQKNHKHFRQKCVFPLSFQTGVSIKDNHSPLAGPRLQQLGEGLKSTTTSSSPTLQGGRWSQDSASRSGIHHHKGLQQGPLGFRSNHKRSLKKGMQEHYFHSFRRNYGCAAGKLLCKLDHIAQHMASHPTLPANLMFESTLCHQNDKKFLHSFTH